MISRRVKIINPSGLHLRPAGNLCSEALKYQSHISVLSGGGAANAKSILSVLGACIKCGDEIEIACEGADEEEAIEAMARIIESGLGE